MADLPPNVYKKETPNAGSGLFASEAVGPGKEVFRIERPLVSVLNQNHLTTACGSCFLWVPENDEDAVDGGNGGEEPRKQKLRACQGCKIVRYCSKDCQTQSWTHSHRHECKIFSKLYPKVLPNTARIVMQLLLRRKANNLHDSEWQAFLALQSHIDDFRSSQNSNEGGLSTWQTIELMSQAASNYSGSKEPMQFIQTLTARVLVNTLTLTTPTFDSLGLTLSPTASLLNHSCTPNTAITYSGSCLTVRSLCEIPPNMELTISYIDTTNATSIRQTELQDRYFFTCTCPACSTNTTNGKPDEEEEDHTFEATLVRAIELQNSASSQRPDQAAPLLKRAIDLFAPYPPHRQPYAAILHTAFLNAISRQDWPTAFAYSLRAYFYIDAVHYQPDWHPVRIVRKWVLLRLVAQIAGLASEGDPSVEALQKFGVDWQIFAMSLLSDISEGIPKSHGEDNLFAKEVEGFAGDTGMVGRSVESDVVESEMVKLRRIAEYGVKEVKMLE